jgi:glycosyltransferase involved in cell wall biosynthesis
MTSVTVCLTTHNDVEVLHRALLSVLGQTVSPEEVLIIDDGSDREVVVPTEPDDYPQIPVRVIRITNRGLPAARNTGLMLAQTEGIVFLDADDWLEPTYIAHTRTLLRGGADVVLTGLQEHGPTRNGTYLPGYDRPWRQVTVEDLWRQNLFFYCALMRVQTLREVGGYHSLMAGAWNRDGGYEDWDLWIDLMTRGAKFDAVNEVLLHYNTATPGSMLARAESNRDALVAEMKRHHRYGDEPIQNVPRAQTVDEVKALRGVGLARLRDSLNS